VIISLTVQVVTKNNSGKTAFALQPSISKALEFNCCRDIISAAQITDDIDRKLLPEASINYGQQPINFISVINETKTTESSFTTEKDDA